MNGVIQTEPHSIIAPCPTTIAVIEFSHFKWRSVKLGDGVIDRVAALMLAYG
jgi:hypothetical protein